MTKQQLSGRPSDTDPTPELLAVAVSGKTYYAVLDPHTTGVPAEIGLPEPTMRRRGRGHQFTYQLTRWQAAEVVDHLETVGYSLAHYTDTEDQDSRSEGRACLRDANKIIRQLQEWDDLNCRDCGWPTDNPAHVMGCNA